jgi:hypothetical protein
VQTLGTNGVAKKKSENKEKIVGDMRNREDERVNRENEIAKELNSLNKVYLN